MKQLFFSALVLSLCQATCKTTTDCKGPEQRIVCVPCNTILFAVAMEKYTEMNAQPGVRE